MRDLLNMKEDDLKKFVAEPPASAALADLKMLKSKIREYVMDDTVRKENFADIEICCEDDNYLANDRVDEIIAGYTLNDCMKWVLELATK